MAGRASRFPECQEIPLLQLGTVSYGQKYEGWELGLRPRENSPAKRGVGGLPVRLSIYFWTIAGVNIRGMTRSGESPEEKSKTWRKKTKPKEDNSFENPKPHLPALSFYYFYILIIQSSEILLAGRWWLLIYHFNSIEVSLYLIGGLSEISDLFSGAKQNKTKQNKQNTSIFLGVRHHLFHYCYLGQVNVSSFSRHTSFSHLLWYEVDLL